MGTCVLSTAPRKLEAHRQHESKVRIGGGRAFGNPAQAQQCHNNNNNNINDNDNDNNKSGKNDDTTASCHPPRHPLRRGKRSCHFGVQRVCGLGVLSFPARKRLGVDRLSLIDRERFEVVERQEGVESGRT